MAEVFNIFFIIVIIIIRLFNCNAENTISSLRAAAIPGHHSNPDVGNRDTWNQ